jgi:hypothetical protein
MRNNAQIRRMSLVTEIGRRLDLSIWKHRRVKNRLLREYDPLRPIWFEELSTFEARCSDFCFVKCIVSIVALAFTRDARSAALYSTDVTAFCIQRALCFSGSHAPDDLFREVGPIAIDPGMPATAGI